LQQLQQVQQVERWERLQQLQQVQQLQQLERLLFTAIDYREVPIKPNSVVYCDIPYQGTADYGKFNHKEFFDWAASRKFPVYVSEYNIDDSRIELVYTIDKISMFSADHKYKIMQEKLYWNKVSNK
jgi:site-specific DNA-adenine methylase